MRKVRGRAGIVVGVLLAWCAYAAALDPSLDISQYAHTSWKIRDGFTKGVINAVAQTPDGYLWLGTEFGLVRFDGVRAVPWQPPSGEQLPSNDIRGLLAARDGTLWIGTQKGLASLKNGKLTTHPELAGQLVARLLEDHEGTIWAGGILPTPPGGRLCAIRGGNAQCYGEDGSLGPGIIGLYEDAQGNLWVGGFNGFWRWRPDHAEFFAVPGETDGVRAFAEDDEGALLIGVNSGIKRLKDGHIEALPLPASAQALRVQAMLRGRDGSLWVASYGDGLVRVYQGKVDVFSLADGLTGDAAAALLEDREGSIWVPTIDGLDRFRAYSVPTISHKQGLTGVTASVLAAKNGSVWIGTNNGLHLWERGQISLYGHRAGNQKSDGKLNGLSPATLFEDSSGRVWVATNREFGYLDNDRFIPIADYPGGYVHSVTELGRGHLWVQNQQAGLFQIFQGKIVQEIPWAKLGHKDFAMSTAADPSGSGIWLGFPQSGVVAYLVDGRIERSYSAADGLAKGRINELRFGPRGSLWAATDGGLSRIRDAHIATLTARNGLPCDAVQWTMRDDNSLWLNMQCGLVRIAQSDVDAWVADPTKTVRTTVFDASDGVRSRLHASGFGPRVTKSADGRIWFTALDGVSIVDPHHLAFNKLPPPVHIEQVTADDKTYDATNGLRLPPHVRYLAIDYTALSLVAPEKVRFRYKLEDEDKDWREVVNKREVQYTNLAPKHYRFRVLACNNSGVWNEQGASLEFVIPPAWYQTDWFRAACLAAFALLLWALYWLRVRQLAYQFNLRLEERVSERTRIARDLHDTLLQSFQALLPRLQAAIYKLPDNAVESRKTLEVAVDQASEAITEGRNAVQGLRASTVEKNDLALAIRTVGEELAAADNSQSSPEFNVVVEGASRELHPILRDEMYRLAAEALRNAFRHAAAQSVEVEIRYDEKHFRLRVRDDGKGIRDEFLRGEGCEGHYGLSGMKERAELVGGQLTIWSEVDNGTEIELVIPASRAYAQPTQRLWKFGRRSPEHVDAKEMIHRE